MITLTFKNGQEVEVINGIYAESDNTFGEVRKAFRFEAIIKDLGEYMQLLQMLGDVANTSEIVLTNKEVPMQDPEGNVNTVDITTLYEGYVDMVSAKFGYLPMKTEAPCECARIATVVLAVPGQGQMQVEKINYLLASVNDVDIADYFEAVPQWSTMGEYANGQYTGGYSEGSRVRYEQLLYKCITEHMLSAGQENMNPAENTELWVRISQPSEEYPEWQAPVSAMTMAAPMGGAVQTASVPNGYAIGAKVTYNGKRKVNMIEGNTYAPDVYGWQDVM